MSLKQKTTYKINPFNIVIFGGDGDLSKRKIIPALFHRYAAKQLNVEFNIYCISRSSNNEKQFKIVLREFILKTNHKESKERDIDEFLKHVKLLQIKKNNDSFYADLKNSLDENAQRQRVFYFSVPSSAFSEICGTLRSSGLVNDSSKVVLEKPLGHDLKSSQSINAIISSTFKEKQIFRIDHYLGKETVQNIMVLRFANHLFERAWNAENIENIQIDDNDKVFFLDFDKTRFSKSSPEILGANLRRLRKSILKLTLLRNQDFPEKGWIDLVSATSY